MSKVFNSLMAFDLILVIRGVTVNNVFGVCLQPQLSRDPLYDYEMLIKKALFRN